MWIFIEFISIISNSTQVLLGADLYSYQFVLLFNTCCTLPFSLCRLPPYHPLQIRTTGKSPGSCQDPHMGCISITSCTFIKAVLVHKIDTDGFPCRQHFSLLHQLCPSPTLLKVLWPFLQWEPAEAVTLEGSKDQRNKFSMLHKTEPKNSGTESSSKNAHPRDTDQQHILTDCVYAPLLSNALINTQSPCTAGETNYHSNWWCWGFFVILYNIIYWYHTHNWTWRFSHFLLVEASPCNFGHNRCYPEQRTTDGTAHHPCHRSWDCKWKQEKKESQQEHELHRGPLSHSLSTGEPQPVAPWKSSDDLCRNVSSGIWPKLHLERQFSESWQGFNIVSWAQLTDCKIQYISP